MSVLMIRNNPEELRQKKEREGVLCDPLKSFKVSSNFKLNHSEKRGVREVQHASEVPKNNSKKFCVIGSPMKIFKKLDFTIV